MMRTIEAEPDDPAMEVMTNMETTTSHTRRSLVLAVAAVVVVAFILGSLNGRGEITDLGSASGDPNPATEVRYIASMVDAFNDADMNRWRAHFAPDADVFGANIDLESNDDYYAGFMALQHRLEITGSCRSLVDLTARQGNYVGLKVGISLGGGVGGVRMQNQNGVILRLDSTQKGINLNLGPKGVTLKLKE